MNHPRVRNKLERVLKHVVEWRLRRDVADGLHFLQVGKARGFTLERTAELLDMSHADFWNKERRTDLSLGVPRKFIESMNSQLVIAARCADGVEITIYLTERTA